jgi:hypothetical protein
MVNEEIIEGLRAALSRGESLKDAMLSFYNSGYNQEEIEEAAMSVYKGSPKLNKIDNSTNSFDIEESENKNKENMDKNNEKKVSGVSDYFEKPQKNRKFLLIALIISLIFLIGISIFIFIFRDRLTDFFH